MNDERQPIIQIGIYARRQGATSAQDIVSEPDTFILMNSKGIAYGYLRYENDWLSRATCKRLVCYLAEHVEKKPTRAKIAMDVGCGLNLVNDCIKMLKNANLINIDKNRCIVRVDDSAAVSFFDTHLPNA